MISRMVIVVTLIFSTLALSACANTVRGVKSDVKATGRAVAN